MVLIDGTDVKRQYLKICTDISLTLERGVLNNIIIPRSENILDSITKIKEEIKEKAETTDKLVQIQSRIQSVKEKEIKAIKNLFADLIKWLM